MVIRPVDIKSESDIQALSEIWRVCFTDDQSYIHSFINDCLPHTISWFLLHQDRPVSLLSLLPSYALSPTNQRISPLKAPSSDHMTKLYGAYIYGVATLPAYRRNSYSQMLLNKAIAYSKEMGFDYIVIKPADKSLFEFYRKVGLDTTLYNNRYIFHLSQNRADSSFDNINHTSYLHAGIPSDKVESDKVEIGQCNNYFISPLDSKEGCDHFTPLSSEQLLILRERYSSYSFLWPPEILRYALIEILSRSGVVAVTQGDLYLIAYPTSAYNINLLETNAETPIQLNRVINYLQKLFPKATTITIDRAARNRANQHLCALLKVLNPDHNIVEALSCLYLSLSME